MITGGDLRQSRLDVGYKTFTISPCYRSDAKRHLDNGYFSYCRSPIGKFGAAVFVRHRPASAAFMQYSRWSAITGCVYDDGAGGG